MKVGIGFDTEEYRFNSSNAASVVYEGRVLE